MHMLRNTTCSLLLIGSLAVVGLATTGCYAYGPGPRVGVGFSVGYPPPPLRAEVIGPAPGYGYAWVPGYWDWGPRGYFWVGGRWTVPPYRHSVWVGPRWEGHRWFRGYWRH